MADGAPLVRALILDDDLVIAAQIARALGPGFAAETLATPLAALERLARPPAVEILLCDLHGPPHDPMTAARAARAAGVAVVLVTGWPEPPEGWLVVAKPFTGRGLRSAARTALARAGRSG